MYWTYKSSATIDGGGDVTGTFEIPVSSKAFGLSIGGKGMMSLILRTDYYASQSDTWIDAGFLGPYRVSMLKTAGSSSYYKIGRIAIRNKDGSVPTEMNGQSVYLNYM